MLDNIRSHYITQRVFSFIESKKAYGIVKYNKSLLNKLKINSLYFKSLCERYLIFEKKE